MPSQVVKLRSIPPKPEEKRKTTPPKHLEPPEKELWRTLTATYSFDEAALALLGEALTSLMRARRCREQIAKEGETISDRFGQQLPHPLLIAEKTSRQAFVQAMKILRLGSTL
jgi:phage terminase small subunit